jgi:hypothetical protein
MKIMKFRMFLMFQRRELRAAHDLGDGHGDIVADFAGDQFVVARENLDDDTVTGEGLDGFGGRVLGRIEERDVAE